MFINKDTVVKSIKQATSWEKIIVKHVCDWHQGYTKNSKNNKTQATLPKMGKRLEQILHKRQYTND